MSQGASGKSRVLVSPDSYVWERQQATNVVDNVLTLVQTYTVTGSILFLDAISVTGTYIGQFSFYLNGTLKETKRTEVTDPSPNVPFYGMPLQVGDVLEIYITHYHTGQLHQFESAIKAHR